jgi:hypothetical protein
MEIGLGIHGEPGVRTAEQVPAREIARLLVDTLLAETPAGAGNEVAVLVNGLGGTKYEEMFVLYSGVAPLLARAGLEVYEAQIGEYVTALDMAGCSLTLFWLDDDLRSSTTPRPPPPPTPGSDRMSSGPVSPWARSGEWGDGVPDRDRARHRDDRADRGDRGGSRRTWPARRRGWRCGKPSPRSGRRRRSWGGSTRRPATATTAPAWSAASRPRAARSRGSAAPPARASSTAAPPSRMPPAAPRGPWSAPS